MVHVTEKKCLALLQQNPLLTLVVTTSQVGLYKCSNGQWHLLHHMDPLLVLLVHSLVDSYPLMVLHLHHHVSHHITLVYHLVGFLSHHNLEDLVLQWAMLQLLLVRNL